MIHSFLDSDSLQRYVKEHNVITWHGIYGMGSLTYIDSDYLGVYVVFDTRKDYELWKSGEFFSNFQLF